jgi:molecular chaperone GrpE
VSKSKKKGESAETDIQQEVLQEHEQVPEEATPDEQESVEAWRDRALRAQAEMANMRRRLEADTEDRTRRRMEALLQELIMVADHMDLALGSLPTSITEAKGADAFLVGMQAIQSSLETVMRQHGLEFIQPASDADFDPELHEAVENGESASIEAELTTLEVLRKGYKMGRRILRPAQVRILSGNK